MNAQGWNICPAYGNGPHEQYVESWLYYWDCFFFVCYWTQTDHRVGQWYSGKTYRAVVGHNCNGSTARKYRIETYGWVKGWVGSSYNFYDGWTAAEATISCNA
jgi:hypothetical protein